MGGKPNENEKILFSTQLQLHATTKSVRRELATSPFLQSFCAKSCLQKASQLSVAH